MTIAAPRREILNERVRRRGNTNRQNYNKGINYSQKNASKWPLKYVTVRSINNNAVYLPTNTTNFISCFAANNSSIFNPQFKNISKNQLQPQTVNSGVYQKGALISSVPNDILGNPRSSPTDLGAYNVAP